jgi:hypothetical protein
MDAFKGAAMVQLVRLGRMKYEKALAIQESMVKRLQVETFERSFFLKALLVFR